MLIDVTDLKTIPKKIEDIIMTDFSQLTEDVVNKIRSANICYKIDTHAMRHKRSIR